MATKKNDVANAADNVQAQTFPLETLRANSLKLFGVSSSTFDGATAGMQGEHSVEEVKNKINKWLKTPFEKGGNE